MLQIWEYVIRICHVMGFLLLEISFGPTLVRNVARTCVYETHVSVLEPVWDADHNLLATSRSSWRIIRVEKNNLGTMNGHAIMINPKILVQGDNNINKNDHLVPSHNFSMRGIIMVTGLYTLMRH